MKKRAHILQPNKGARLPKWVLFLDTETRDVKVDAKTKRLELKLGYAVLTRRNDNNILYPVSEMAFRTREELYTYLDGSFREKERIYIVAHNIGFDVRVVHLLDYFAERGFERTSFIDSAINFIVRYKRGTSSVVLLNNMQFFNMSLRKLGESIGFPKQEVNFDTVDDETLAAYCKNDVMVMLKAWNVLIGFIHDNDLGNFTFTAASQAMGAYRHRFMPHDIFIHNDERVIKLERESYHGGRTECFYIGDYHESNVHYLDVNSMYPHVMHERKMPYKLIRYLRKIDLKTFMRIHDDYGYIVEAEIEILHNTLPVKYNDRLTFPIGRVKGVFAKPEFEKAMQTGRVVSLGRIAIYKEDYIFTDFVKFFYEKRLQYKKEGNAAFAFLCKLMLNSLYGKFGQRNLVYTRVGITETIPDGMYHNLDTSTKKYVNVRVLNGVVEKETGFEEGYNAFVGIASYVTSHARVLLDNYIEIAGRSETLYCDTDSLFTTEKGANALQQYINPTTLGMLKCEGVDSHITIWAPKWYRFTDHTRIKGIRDNAEAITETLFEQDKFVGFRGSLRAHDTNSVIVSKVRKMLHTDYKKGVVTPSGRVLPFEFH